MSGLYEVVVIYPHETNSCKAYSNRHMCIWGLRAESRVMKSIRTRKYTKFKELGVVGPKRVIVNNDCELQITNSSTIK